MNLEIDYRKAILFNDDFIKQFIDNPEFDFLQEKEIELGLLQGIDVKKYCDIKYSAEEMRKIRKENINKKIIQKYNKRFCYYINLFWSI